MRVPRELRGLARAAQQAGWTIRLTGGDHLRWESPDGTVVHSSGSPSDRREFMNVRSRLRRAGLDV